MSILHSIGNNWPSYVAALGVALNSKRGVARSIAKHAAQVNQVIQWALAQQPPQDKP
jgi:hypothetical protein